jgi:periodic tryptophan protein 1
MLSSFPLSLEWLNVELGSIGSQNPAKGNYAIVSTFLPEIEIWNLDMAETVEPDLVLGGEVTSGKKKPKKFTNKAKKYK